MWDMILIRCCWIEFCWVFFWFSLSCKSPLLPLSSVLSLFFCLSYAYKCCIFHKGCSKLVASVAWLTWLLQKRTSSSYWWIIGLTALLCISLLGIYNSLASSSTRSTIYKHTILYLREMEEANKMSFCLYRSCIRLDQQLTSLAIVTKDFSTLISFFALVSKNWIPKSLANDWPSSVVTTVWKKGGKDEEERVAEYMMKTFFLTRFPLDTHVPRWGVISHLLPMRILFTWTSACCWICPTQLRIDSNDLCSAGEDKDRVDQLHTRHHVSRAACMQINRLTVGLSHHRQAKFLVPPWSRRLWWCGNALVPLYPRSVIWSFFCYVEHGTSRWTLSHVSPISW